MTTSPRAKPRALAFACALISGLVAGSSGLRAALAADLHARMGAGINYGQHFESDRFNELTPAIPQAKFATLRQHGFKHVRIPVSWGWRLKQPWAGANSPVQIDATFKASVKLSVDRALAEGLIVILNTHHEHWFQRYYSKENNARIRLNSAGTDYYAATEAQGGRPAMEIYKDLWREIVATFDGDPKYEDVIFEGLNEPRIAANSDIGAFTDAQVNTVNNTVFNLLQDDLNQTNRRVYMMTVNNANNAKSFKHLTIPTRSGWSTTDVRNQLMVTIHYYHSQDWTHADNAASPHWGTTQDFAELIERFNDITPDSSSKFSNGSSALVGVKVNIGEFGIKHQLPNNGGPSNRDPGDILEWYRVVAAAAKHRGHSYTVWCDNGWFRVFNRNSGTGGGFNWGDNYMSELWKMVTLHENQWRLKSALNTGWNLASSGVTWSPWQLKSASGTDTFQRFQFQVDPGVKLTQERDRLRYPALRNVGAGKFLDVEFETTPGNGNAIRNRHDVLDSAFDHYVSTDYEGNGLYALAIPLPGPLYHGSSGTRRVIRVPENAGVGTSATLWDFGTSNAVGQRWSLEQVAVP